MNIIFLTLSDFKSYSEHNIYCDLLREFVKNSHEVYCISPAERRNGIETHFEENRHLLRLKIGNTQKTDIVEKGISMLMIEQQFVSAINKYFADVKFDLVLYSTPPITLVKVVNYIKKRDRAKTYLMLKDIFPQNAVDLKMMSKGGLRGLIYKYFRYKEKKLYAISDYIGCMSQANVEYILKHNPEIDSDTVEVCPNCIEVTDKRVDKETRNVIRKRYGIPTDKTVFVYGGNIGKPQGIDFIIDCLKSQKNNEKAFFLIVGDGTEYRKLESYVNSVNQLNLKLMKLLPKEEYDTLAAACDIGLIFLDHRFTIPNFPSRLLGYMQAKLPVLACTDSSTDIGKTIVDGKFGWWCESNDIISFDRMIKQIGQGNWQNMRENEFFFLKENYSSEICYNIIISHFMQ